MSFKRGNVQKGRDRVIETKIENETKNNGGKSIEIVVYTQRSQCTHRESMNKKSLDKLNTLG